MKHRTFPNTDIRVSEVGFGTWTVSTGWWGDKSDADAVAMMRRALDEHGVTFCDAADAYGNGRAERQLAEAFRGRRDEIVIGTKIASRRRRRNVLRSDFDSGCDCLTRNTRVAWVKTPRTFQPHSRVENPSRRRASWPMSVSPS